jgi:hypothetical protein
MNNFRTITEAVVYVVKHYRKGHQFYGNELHNDVSAIYKPAMSKYPDTLLRIMRRHCYMDYVLINRNKSLYKKI